MDALVLPGLVVGLALLVAGALKVGRRDGLAASFNDLAVPGPLAATWAVRSLPWTEVVLGVAVLVVPAPASLVPAVLATALLAAYAVLVARAVTRRTTAVCACFGVEEAVGPRTVARNLLLLAAAVVATADAVRGHSPVQRLLALDAGGWGWLLGAVVVAALVVLAVGRAPGSSGVGTARGIPFLVLHHPDGTGTSLPELAALRPQLLVHLSETCPACHEVAAALPGWRDRLADVDLRVVSGTAVGAATPAEWGEVLHDPQQRVAVVLGLVHPSAVLLGADALVAAGPVHGADAIRDLVTEMEQALRA